MQREKEREGEVKVERDVQREGGGDASFPITDGRTVAYNQQISRGIDQRRANETRLAKSFPSGH